MMEVKNDNFFCDDFGGIGSDIMGD